MRVIAITKEGFILEAVKSELVEILTAVNGSPVEDKSIVIGTKVPALDYATTIKRLKNIKDEYAYRELMRQGESFYKELLALKERVLAAETIET